MIALKEMPVIRNQRVIKRGDIYLCHLPKENGSVQANLRPVIVIQNNIGNRFSSTLIVIPLSKRYKELPTQVKLEQGIGGMFYDSFAYCEQIRTIDKSWLDKFVGTLDTQSAPFRAIENAVLISLGFSLP